ncbi:MAG: ABC transporter substrate-binding protein [Pseudomonadota bacterium]
MRVPGPRVRALLGPALLWLVVSAATVAAMESTTAPEPTAAPAATTVSENPAAESNLAQQIEAFHETLAGLADLADGPARRAQLAPRVESLFDMPLIARLSLGLRWRELSAEDQQAFITALRAVVVATYSARFARPSTARFELLETVAGRRGPVVRSRIARSDGSAVPLDYHFRNGKIYNVVADGVSDLSLRRADYSGVLKQEGYAALRSHMDAQRTALEKEDDESE